MKKDFENLTAAEWKIEYQRLVEKNKRVERELESRNAFLTELSHRMRTPVSALCGMSILARRNADNPAVLLDYLGKIDFCAEVLLNQITVISDLEAIRKCEIVANNARFDFKLLLSTVSSICSSLCSERDIYFDILLNGITEETLVGDSLRLNQILLLITRNSIDASAPGSRLKLKISQHMADDGVVNMHFDIVSSDLVVSAKDISSISDNTGEGELSLAASLCELIGGRLQITSRRGLGTIFSFTLPFGIVVGTSAVTADALKDYSALIVSSDAQTVETVGELFKRVGVNCVCVPTREAAVAALSEAREQNKPFDVCFVDWSVSTADGIAASKEIRTICGDRLGIVAITPTESVDLYDAARIAGANRILPKPIFQSSVFNLLMELTGKTYANLSARLGEFDFCGRRILLAEDNDLNADIAGELLGDVNIITERADNGEDAIQMYIASKPNYYDLILMDLRMPLRDGFSTAKAIRSLPRRDAGRVPIIALTADAFSADISEALSSGMDNYIIKPIDTQQLYLMLNDYLKG